MRPALTAAVLALAAAPAFAHTPPAIMGNGTATAAPAISPEAAARVGTLPVGATPGEVVLTGLDGRADVLKPADIAAMPRSHVAVEHDGKTVDYSGPALVELLRRIDAPMGVRLHGQGVNDVVFVTGADRFRAVFSLAELDPSFHKGAHAILADQADGAPIAGKQGPYRLIVEGDQRPARSVYAVVSIRLVHLP